MCRSRAKQAAVPKAEGEQLPEGSQAADGSQADAAQATPKARRRKAGDPPDYRAPLGFAAVLCLHGELHCGGVLYQGCMPSLVVANL